MISTNEFKTGVTFVYENNIYQVLEFLHVKPGKGAAFVRSKLRNLRTGAVIEITFNAGEKFSKAQIDKTPMQYLYAQGNMHVFMNNETYDQIEIDEKQIANEIKFITEGFTVDVIVFNNSEVLGISIPEKVTLKVKETVPGVKGDTKTNATKDAILETGILVKVPLFIDTDELIVVNTNDGSYVSRAKN